MHLELCSREHAAIAFSTLECPLCPVIKENKRLESVVDDLEEEVGVLNSELSTLEDKLKP